MSATRAEGPADAALRTHDAGAPGYDGRMVSRYFGFVPAAGHSRRMGRPKLLLPLAGRALVLHTIEAWRRSGVERTIVVVRPGDDALFTVLREAAADWPNVDIVVPEVAPPDMKESLKAAVRHVEGCYKPGLDDAFLVAPADMPKLSAAIIGKLIGQHRDRGKHQIIAPTIAGRRGHPVLFPWGLAAELFRLGDDEGLKTIVERHEVRWVEVDDLVSADEQAFADVDTPEEYERLVKEGNFRGDLTADERG